MTRDELYDRLEKDLRDRFGDQLYSAGIDYGMLVVTNPPELHHEIAAWAKEHEFWKFNHFIDITAVDQYTRFDTHRFEVVVHLRSHTHNLKFRYKTLLPADRTHVPTLTDLYAGASWSEREAYDLGGITFDGHPRMTRIMNPDDFVGHPLRKDFPVKGLHRGSFPRGTVVSNKRRESVVAKQTKPKPADQILPRTPLETRRERVRGEDGDA
ncbi:MAG: NADH-quinone oxidoreductase subunit C/D [Calditrichaeota bacterium]|nr:NADH-quinone oxidoreductase subunit C/D [Calditrichota bacterium]